MRLLLIVCADVESNPGPGSDKRVRVLDSNISPLHANFDELVVVGSDYVLVCNNNNNNNIPRLFPSLRRGSHAKGILTIFTQLTIEMMNSVGSVMAS